MKRTEISLFAIICFVALLSGQLGQPISASTSGGLSEGDIVNAHYILTLYGFQGSGTEEFFQEGDLDGENSVTVTANSMSFLQKFVDALFGMYEGETKKFVIDAADGYTNPSDTLYGKDLYYEVTITKVIYDALPLISDEGTTSSPGSNPTTTGGTTPRPNALLLMGLLGAVGLIVVGGPVFYFRSRATDYESIQETREMVATREKSQLQEITKILEERREKDGREMEEPKTKRTHSARRRR